MNAYVIFVVGGVGEVTVIVGFGVGVGSFVRVGAYMYFADIRCGEGAVVVFEGVSEWAFICGDGVCEGFFRKGFYVGVRSRESIRF